MLKAKRRSARRGVLPSQLSELEKWPHFVLRSGGRTVSRRGVWCDALDPTNHLTAPAAHRIARKRNFTLCYVLTREDPFFLVVLKNTIRGGRLTPYAQRTLDYFSNAFVSYAPGNRIHIFGRGDTQFDHPERFDELEMEFYTERYIVGFPDIESSGSASPWH